MARIVGKDTGEGKHRYRRIANRESLIGNAFQSVFSDWQCSCGLMMERGSPANDAVRPARLSHPNPAQGTIGRISRRIAVSITPGSRSRLRAFDR